MESTAHRKMSWKWITAAVLAVVVAGVIGVAVGVAGLVSRKTDITAQIRPFCEHTYACERNLWVVDMDKKRWLCVDDLTNFPKTLKEYRDNPQHFPFDIVDEMPADTRFKIVKCIKVDDPFNATGYWLTAEVTEGKYVGDSFQMFSTDVFSRNGDLIGGKWELQDYLTDGMAKVP